MYEDLIARLKEYAENETDENKKQDLLEAAYALEARFKIRTSREELTIQEAISRLEERYRLLDILEMSTIVGGEERNER